jgi:hypothetical protein
MGTGNPELDSIFRPAVKVGVAALPAAAVRLTAAGSAYENHNSIENSRRACG